MRDDRGTVMVLHGATILVLVAWSWITSWHLAGVSQRVKLLEWESGVAVHAKAACELAASECSRCGQACTPCEAGREQMKPLEPQVYQWPDPSETGTGEEWDK